MLDRLAQMPILHKYMAGGTGALTLVFSVYAFTRSLTIAGILVAALLLATVVTVLFNFFLKGRKKLKASAFDKGLQADTNKAGKGNVESRKATSELATRWNNAIKELKGAGMNLYDLPWYMLIGEPQSGKSTTLKNSGLEFPVGTEALSGAGGTRNCDWWFTNEAVILDTAGRFTFQEKNAPDAEEWTGFLKLLKKNRNACPINGVVLTIPCTSLLGDDDAVRETKAQNIREKLIELQRALEVQFPVFILLTKADMMLGFTEFFSRLSATEQRQMMGWSMHGPFIQAYDPESFDKTFDTIYDRVHKLRLKFIGEDVSLSEIDKLYVFPEEFKSVREPLSDYLKIIFVKTNYLKPLFFRGFYFTSGAQTGKPIAKACAAMLRTAGPGAEEIVEHLQKIFERSRAFFIRDFYVDKLFPERNLTIRSVEKMKMSGKITKLAVFASIALILLTLGLGGWQIYKLSKGIGGIQTLAKEVRDDFFGEMNEKKPLSADEAADNVQLAANFAENAKKTEEAMSGLNLHPDLRDMHWMYMTKNSLQDQTRALYAELESTKPGESLTDATVSDKYATYIKLWSMNDVWLDHTANDEGGFDEVDAIAFPGMLQEGIGEDTQKAFQEQLALVRTELAEPVDFSSNPIELPLAPGEREVGDNDVIAKEIRAVAEGFKPVDPGAVMGIVTAATNLRNAYAQAIQGVMNASCGYADAGTDPFAATRDSIKQVRDLFAALDTTLTGQGDILRSLDPDPVAIRKSFDALKWVDAAVKGDARKDLETYIDEQVDAISKRLGQEAIAARQPLTTVSDVIVTSGALAQHPGLIEARKGLDLIEAYIDAQNQTVSNIAARTIKNTDDVNNATAEWLANAPRDAANAWATAAAGRADLNPTWRVADLGVAVQTMIAQGDESVGVEAWLGYLKQNKPGVLLSSGQIGGASLDADPPGGAKPDNVATAADALNAIKNDSEKFKQGIKCDINAKRLTAEIESVDGIIKQNEKNFFAFWKSALGNWRPDSWISGIGTWEDFKSNPVMQGTALNQRINSALSVLESNLQGYKDKFNTAGELDSLLKDLTKLLRSGEALETNSNLFSNTVGELDLNKLTAKGQLEEKGSNGMTRDKALDQIAAIASIGPKFSSYPIKVRSLLEGGDAEFKAELAAFMKRWAEKLGNKFPFAVSDAKPNSIPQVDSKDFVDFYFGADSLPAFLTKYEGFYPGWSAKGENAGVKEFIDECLTLRDFYFGKEGKEFRDIKITPTYDVFQGATKESIQQVSNLLYLYVPSPAAEPKRIGFQSAIYPTTGEPFTFKPGEINDDSNFRFQSMLDRAYKSEGEVGVGGDFSVLAYIQTQTTGAKFERKNWPVIFQVDIKSNDNDPTHNGTFKLNFTFVTEDSLPEQPDWSKVDGL